ncbi:MAG: endolytic transglycosylase MltG [Alphaproteobacteria bacterium]|nr:endolytic transglycosylase MltG [Alphaproteobacteria bacterium]
MIRFILIALLVIVVIVAGAFEWESAKFTASGPAPKETVVLIKPKTGLKGISEQLAAVGAIDSPEMFQLDARYRQLNDKFKAGEYAIPAHASYSDIMNILVEGKSIQHKITAAEGLTSEMIVNLINKDPVLIGPPLAIPPEGTLLPETYLFMRGDTRQQILARMQKAQKEFIAKHWPKRDKNLPYTTIKDAIILASIVEKETGIASERPHVAAVFVNRLRLGMKLESDPTIIYSITRGYPLGRGIRRSELDRVTPYNSYAVAGLPPTPICNPGKDAIAAVMNPGETKDLYFVAAGNGGHYFSATLADQQKHVHELRDRERIEKATVDAAHALPVPDLRLKH